MSTSDLDLQRERAGRNQATFRAVNERIAELSSEFQLDDGGALYVCECDDMSCLERIAISHDEYRRVRRHPTEFFVVPGHEHLEVEEIVDRTDRWLVVRKLGAGATVAVELDQSRDEQ